MAMLMLLRRMQRPDKPASDKAELPRWCDGEGRPITPHGFRASFRTWAGDQTDFAREVVEAALAHVITNKVEAAYARGDLLDRRRALMAAWGDVASGGGEDDCPGAGTNRSASK